MHQYAPGVKYLLACLLFALPALAQRPNVLLIVSDDQSWTDYGFEGHPEIGTPHLAALPATGAHLSRGYVPSSLCRPSLATIVTGRYPHEHGITGNDPPRGVARDSMLAHLRAQDPLPARLARAGYLLGAVCRRRPSLLREQSM